jgi:hypothetical protein
MRNDQPNLAGQERDSTAEKETVRRLARNSGTRGEFGWNEVFELLQNQRRRQVLRYLRENEAPVRIGELAEHIAAKECDKEPRRVSSQERKRVYVGLYQCHLPKMDDRDAVDYNKPRGVLEPGDKFPLFETYLPDEAGRGGQDEETSLLGWVHQLLS